MDSIKAVIHDVILKISAKQPSAQTTIQKTWDHITDGKTKNHARVSRFDQGKLFVYVDSPAWLFHMNTQKGKILKELTRENTGIQDIVFKIGKVK